MYAVRSGTVPFEQMHCAIREYYAQSGSDGSIRTEYSIAHLPGCKCSGRLRHRRSDCKSLFRFRTRPLYLLA